MLKNTTTKVVFDLCKQIGRIVVAHELFPTPSAEGIASSIYRGVKQDLESLDCKVTGKKPRSNHVYHIINHQLDACSLEIAGVLVQAGFSEYRYNEPLSGIVQIVFRQLTSAGVLIDDVNWDDFARMRKQLTDRKTVLSINDEDSGPITQLRSCSKCRLLIFLNEDYYEKEPAARTDGPRRYRHKDACPKIKKGLINSIFGVLPG